MAADPDRIRIQSEIDLHQSYGYPIAREGPKIPYHNDAGSNPVLRGWTLTLISSLIAWSTFLQGLFWRLNKFDKLKELSHLAGIEPRHDPTVVPRTRKSVEKALQNLPEAHGRKTDQHYYTCKDYHDAYRSGKVTPLQVVETLLPMITRPDGKHSVGFLRSDRDMIVAAAQASTNRYKNGKHLSVLDGCPVGVKDEAEVAGYKRTLGSKLDFTDPGNETAWCVKKWEEAGLIVMGKTSMHEIGLSTTNHNPVTGTPRNPHNPAYYCGGSSGGSAYSVAAGLVPITLGADGGGSIRVPSSYTGLYGLKPSHSRVSGRPTRDLGCSVGVYGPIASSIEDLRLAYQVMAQPDPLSSHSAMFPNPSDEISSSEAKPKLIGIYDSWIDRADPEVHKLFDHAIEHLEKCGYKVVDISIPLLPEAQKAHALTILSEIRSGLTNDQISKLLPSNQLLLNVSGNQGTALDFISAQKLRNLMMKHLSFLWQQHPGMLILTPTTPAAGWKINTPNDVGIGGADMSDSDQALRSMEYVYVANFAGTPAISCPMGYTNEDVPFGLMAMAEWGAEEQLLDFASDAEGALDAKGVRRPSREGCWVDVLSLAQTK